MKVRHMMTVALLAGLVMVGCDQAPVADGGGSAATPVASDTGASDLKDFKVDKPVAYTGEFNPDEVKVGLAVGNLAPEISGADLDGVDFKLSDYRGKVVMLDFWGDW